MRTRTTQAAAFAAITLLLTGCSSGGDGRDKFTPASAPASDAEGALTKAEITQRCVDAIAYRAAASKNGAVRSEPVPQPCVPLSDSDYLDAYMAGLDQARKAAQDKQQEQNGQTSGGTAG